MVRFATDWKHNDEKLATLLTPVCDPLNADPERSSGLSKGCRKGIRGSHLNAALALFEGGVLGEARD